MRLTLNIKEVNEILNLLEDKNPLCAKISTQLENEIKKDKTTKRNATATANEAKVNNSKDKVLNAINLLRMENKKINANTISEVANINYKTASKYFKQFNIKE